MKKKRVLLICSIAFIIIVGIIAAVLIAGGDKFPTEGDCRWTGWSTDGVGVYGEKILFTRSCLDCGAVQEYYVSPCEHITVSEDNDGYGVIKGTSDCDCRFLYLKSEAPDGKEIKTIGEGAFLDRTDVKYIYVENGITVLENAAFAGCNELLSSVLPESVEVMDGLTYYECNKLYSANVPEKVKSLGEFTFGGCTSMKNVEIPSGVSEIEDGCFVNCVGMEEITLPESVKKLGKLIFAGCENLKSITMSGVEGTIQRETFAGCIALTEFRIPDGVDTIVCGAFLNCAGLEKLYIPIGVTVLEFEEGESPFPGCDEKKLTVFCQAEKAPEKWLEGYDICNYIEKEDGTEPVRLKFVFGAEF